MADEVTVQPEALVPLTGLDLSVACLVSRSPWLTALTGPAPRQPIEFGDRRRSHWVGDRSRPAPPGIGADLSARHPHQQEAAQRLGASPTIGDGYDVVLDCVATSSPR